MRKKIAFCVAVFLAALVVRAAAVLPLPGTNGPSLGDTITNLYSVVQAITFNNQLGFQATVSVSQTSGQANCTQLNNNPQQNITTSSSTGYACLPSAFPGREIFIGNATGQTINLYGSATTAVVGTQDTINGTAGSSAYGGLTSGKNTQCFAPAIGTWYCSSGS